MHRLSPLRTHDDDERRRRALMDAAFTVIDGMSEDELLSAVTPARIGELIGYSASSVRYQLGAQAPDPDQDGSGSRWTFDRRALLESMLDELERRITETTLLIRDRYLKALDEAARRRDLMPLFAAVVDDLEAYAPGSGDTPATLSERTYLLAVAAADGSPAIARRLRAIRDGELEIYAVIYERSLRLSGRRLRPGRTVRGMAEAIANLAEGASITRRYTPSSPATDLTTAEGMLGAFVAFTEPDDRFPDAPLRALRCGDRDLSPS